MTESAERVLSQALSLDEQERAEIAARLLETLDSSDDQQLDPEWQAEIEERSRQLASGEESAIPWEQVKQMLARPDTRKADDAR